LIISASYKTDIPTFYGDWFINRLRAGYCKMVNPYGRRVYTVPLTREHVDGFVFWTKNVGPFMPHLAEVAGRGYPFMVQYTITGYPQPLEHSVLDPRSSVEHMQALANEYGPRVGVWRYDTILFTSLTPVEWHLGNFSRLAHELQGATDEVVVSFAQMYRKTQRNLDQAANEHGFQWEDPSDEVKWQVATELAGIARQFGIQLSMCSQRQFLAPGVADARCVDARRLSDVAGYEIKARLRGNRADCGCYESKDIGAYDTCPHGCVYCYAVSSRPSALRRYREHDPKGEFLRADEARYEVPCKGSSARRGEEPQLPLSS